MRLRPTGEKQKAEDAQSPCDENRGVLTVQSSNRAKDYEECDDVDDERIEDPMETSRDETKKRRHSTNSPFENDSADGCSRNGNHSSLRSHSTQGNTKCDKSEIGTPPPLSTSHANIYHEATKAYEGDVHAAKRTKINGGDDSSSSSSIQPKQVETTRHTADDENQDEDSDIVCLGSIPSKKEEHFSIGVQDNSDALAALDVATINATSPRKSECHSQFEEEKGIDCHGDEQDDFHGFENIPLNNNYKVGKTNDSFASSVDISERASDCESKTQPDTTTMQPLPSPKKDVCYICGSDLTRLKSGLRGRVAHMKRCSAKYNGMAFRESMTVNHHEDTEDDPESCVADIKPEPSHNTSESDSVNPHNNGHWHKYSSNSQPKQTVLRDFFKAPVKCLTNVLMAGARQVAKKEATITPLPKGGIPSSRWGSSYRRNGNCPTYKRIPGTDFICDGFQFATRTLSENYFLTHFHSDVSYFSPM